MSFDYGGNPKGKTVRIYLPDGSPTGLQEASIANLTLRAVAGPWAKIAEIRKEDWMSQGGVYLLAGDDPESFGDLKIYVGETEDFQKRLINQHLRAEDKYYVSRFCTIFTTDDRLTKAHIRFLEAKLHQQISLAGRANLDNSQTPKPSSLPKEDRADMAFLLQQLEIILPLLGFDILRPKRVPRAVVEEAGATPQASSSDGETLFEIVSTERLGLRAEMVEREGEFIVLKDSVARKEGQASWTAYKDLRAKLVEKGVLVDHPTDPEKLIFQEDYAFKSPSAAGSVVYARNTNGPTHWKVKGSKRTYSDWQESQLAEPGVAE